MPNNIQEMIIGNGQKMKHKVTLICSSCNKKISVFVEAGGMLTLFQKIKKALPAGWKSTKLSYLCETCSKESED